MAQQGEVMAQELEQGEEELLDEKQAPGAFSRTLVAFVQEICEMSSQPVPRKTKTINIQPKNDRKQTT